MKLHRSFTLSVDELVHQRVGGVHDLVRRALCGNPAVGQNDDLIGNAKSFFEVVRDHDAGDAQRVIELADQLRSSA